jgi:DNA-binding YbaB/EbfC family protein
MNIAKMMKDLQKAQARLQQDIDALEVEASSGGGVVVARMNGKKYLTSLRLSPEAITPDDPGLVQDLVLAAVNEASRKVDAEIQRMTEGLAGGFKLPGMG